MTRPSHDPRVAKLAAELEALRSEIRGATTTPQLAHSSVENGALRVRDDEYPGDTMKIGRQFDDTFAPATLAGPVPAAPSVPSVTNGTGGLAVAWNGGFIDGSFVPMDFLRVDVHVGTTSNFTATQATIKGSILAPSGGTAAINLEPGTYYVRLVAVTAAGKWSAASNPVQGISEAAVATSDGNAPASSPPVIVLSGHESITVRWANIANGDPVTYDVHVSDTSQNFTPTVGTLAGSTAANQFHLRALPGPDPLPGQVDTRALVWEKPYYFRVVARDADGSAAPGAGGMGMVYQLTGVDILADSITGLHIQAGTITGREFAGEVGIFGKVTTRNGGLGGGHDISPEHIATFRSDGTTKFRVPVADNENPFIDGEFVARGLRVTAGATFESNENEVSRDAALNLAVGTTAPGTAPQLVVTYDTVRPVFPVKTGPLGTFGLVPSEVSYVEWNVVGQKFHIHQVRPNGTRVWKVDRQGVIATYSTQDDIMDWAVYGQTYIPSGSAAGYYNLFRFIPAGNTWYIAGQGMFNTYTRTNPNRIPAIGNNGNILFVAEALADNSLRVTYHSMTTNGAALSAPQSTFTSGTGIFGASPVHVERGAFDFGVGADRYIVAERGVGYNTKSLATQFGGSTLLVTNSENFESPVSSRLGQCWDGTNFWTYGSDGILYKHTSERWNPDVSSSTWWFRATAADTDAGGTGPHETTMGPARSLFMPRRAKLAVTLPAVQDNGGADDPDRANLYATRGASEPASTAYRLQSTAGSGTVVLTSLATATAAPPLTNNFPGATPAQIRATALHTDGQRMFWVDGSGDGRWVGEGWRTVGAAGQPAFGTGFTAVSGYPVQFRRNPVGQVEIRGLVNVGAGGATIFTLPSGYFPVGGPAVLAFPQHTAPLTSYAFVGVSNTGAVTYNVRSGTPTQCHVVLNFSAR